MTRERIFNIAGPCFADKHYMLPAMSRLSGVARLLRDESYFVLHAQRQCGKTTAFRNFADEINVGDDAVAMYCSLETLQGQVDEVKAMAMAFCSIRGAAQRLDALRECHILQRKLDSWAQEEFSSEVIIQVLRELSLFAKKPLYVFFDEVDCLCNQPLISFLRQLRNGSISNRKGYDFPASIALIGMRNIRDYKARIRPDSETIGSASPFNVIAEATTLRVFTLDEVRELYQQHTDATGQVFEPGVVERAFEYSCGQPYLVNALARWCVDKIHDRRYSERITLDDMHEAKEKIIRERGTHLDSLMERMKEERVRRIVEPVMLGKEFDVDVYQDDLSYVKDLGILVEENKILKPANPIYSEIIGRYISWGTQKRMAYSVPETPWVKDDGLDMQGLLAAFQQFWRENAQQFSAPYNYNEAYAQIVLQAFLQRVINGGGEIIREMALGKRALDLGVKFRGATYALECKLRAQFDKSHEAAYAQVLRYMDSLGQNEGWLIVFDPDLTKPWDGKIGADEQVIDGKQIHIIFC